MIVYYNHVIHKERFITDKEKKLNQYDVIYAQDEQLGRDIKIEVFDK